MVTLTINQESKNFEQTTIAMVLVVVVVHSFKPTKPISQTVNTLEERSKQESSSEIATVITLSVVIMT
jgi:hypothetical protein